MGILNGLYLLALSVWVGTQVFFFGATSAVFRSFDRPLAGDVVGVLFPTYYAFGYVTNALLTLLAFARWRSGSAMGGIALLLALLILGLTLYAGLVLLPKVDRAGQQLDTGDEAARARFGRLHGLSMLLNTVSLILALVLLGLAATAWARGVR